MERQGLARFAPLTGVVFVALAVASFILSNDTPDSDDGTIKTVAYWVDNDGQEIASAICATYAAFFLVWFAGSLRSAIARVEEPGGRLAALVLGGGVAAAVGISTNAALEFAAAESAGDVPPQVTQTLSVLYSDFFFPIVVGFVAFLLAAGLAIVRSGLMPAWLGWAAVVLGVIGLTPVGFVGILISLIWILVVSVILFQTATGPQAPEAPTSPGVGAPPAV